VFLVRSVLVTVLLLAALVPATASAAVVDASLMPDGTYTVKVEKIPDAQHALVMMQNGVETMLVAAGSADFSKCKPNDMVKISIIKGKVPVLQVQ
jgi:hypothetical protein